MKKCPECGSEKIIKDVRIVGTGENYADFPARAVVYEKPEALLLKGKVDSALRAEGCADCGFLQAYISEPKRLWVTYKIRTTNVE